MICVKCQKDKNIDCFYSKTLNKMSEYCNKCRAKSYKISNKNIILRYTKKKNNFIVSNKHLSVLNDDVMKIIFDYLDNYTKFQLCLLYGNIFTLKCCSNKALYSTISTNNVICNYCYNFLNRKYDWFTLYCDDCITDDIYDNYFLEDKGECLCNGKRQIYEIEFKTVII